MADIKGNTFMLGIVQTCVRRQAVTYLNVNRSRDDLASAGFIAELQSVPGCWTDRQRYDLCTLQPLLLNTQLVQLASDHCSPHCIGSELSVLRQLARKAGIEVN